LATLQSVPAGETMDLGSFTGWLDAALEQASFLPDPADEAGVVITPLARAMLRPFCAVVFPGADDHHLGAAPAPHGLLRDGEAQALGLPDRRATSDAEIQAFAQILRLPKLTLLHRASDAGEPCAASPLIELLALAIQRARPEAWNVAADARVALPLGPTPLARPQPRAPSLLPQRLSASACEALRTCPYKFFALRLLGLREAEELDAELEKREYGNWLHAVLQRFHAQRTEAMPADADAASLQEIAREVLNEQGLDEAEFLPYSASFARLVPRYVDWLHQRDGAGAKWLDAELSLSTQPPKWGEIQMHGVIDRVDFVDEDGVPTTQLIDYKTGSAQPLSDAIKRGEDTQLAFYAALMAAQGDDAGELGAMYLMLDESSKIREIKHADVRSSAAALVDGIGRELAQIRAGAAMPALGEGQACEHCDARGLCRRDHWPSTADLAR
jgi:ATP-dependent helicase/nuclease subunit B